MEVFDDPRDRPTQAREKESGSFDVHILLEPPTSSGVHGQVDYSTNLIKEGDSFPVLQRALCDLSIIIGCAHDVLAELAPRPL